MEGTKGIDWDLASKRFVVALAVMLDEAPDKYKRALADTMLHALREEGLLRLSAWDLFGAIPFSMN